MRVFSFTIIDLILIQLPEIKRLITCVFVLTADRSRVDTLICFDMPTITSFFARKKRPRSKSPDVCLIVPSPKKTRIELPPSPNPTRACDYPCCDLSNPDPTRFPLDKASTAREIQKRIRYFQPDWLGKYKWLVHCRTGNKAYCNTCRFAISSDLKKNLDTNGAKAFTTTGFTNWKTATEQFVQHENSLFHKDSDWLIRQSKEGKPIDEQLASVSENIKVARRKCLMEQLKVLRLLARQGIASRNSDISESNLVQFLGQSSVADIKKYLSEKQYLSPEVNAELIKEMYRVVILSIVEDVKKAKFFAIVLDETRDVSGMLLYYILLLGVMKNRIRYL